MKTQIKISCFILLFILLIACNEDEITKINNELAGTYNATKFTEPGLADNGIDIISNKGSLTIQFNGKQKISGHILIPKNISSNYSYMDTDFNGTYSVKKDTIRFSNSISILDNKDVYFLLKDLKLETPTYKGRWALFKIVLKKE